MRQAAARRLVAPTTSGRAGNDVITYADAHEVTLPYGMIVNNVAGAWLRMGLIAGAGAGAAAAAGTVRLQDDFRLAARNAADGADLGVISMDGADNLYIGGTNPNRPSSIVVDATNTISIVGTGGTAMQFFPTGAGVVADLLTVHSQDATSAGAAPTGGGLLVRAGDGTAGNGNGGDADFRPGAASGAGTPGTLALQDSTGADVLRVDATGLSTDLAIHHNRTVVNFGMSPYALAVGDHVLGVTTAGGAVTLDLPAAAANTDRHLIVKDEGGVAVGANITVDANGGELIDGALTAVINANYGAIQLYCDGTGWYIY
jgi:hypothetical protein